MMGCIITGNAFSGTQLNDLIIRLINTSVIYKILDLGYRRPQTKYLLNFFSLKTMEWYMSMKKVFTRV